MLAIVSVFMFQLSTPNLFAQKVKKNKTRLNVQYVKLMDEGIYFNIKASSRIKKKNVKVSDIEVIIYNVLEDEKTVVGKTTTNKNGESKFKVKNLNLLQADSSNTYTITVAFKGNDTYNKAKKSIQFKDARIEANIITKDSINYVSATLTDAINNLPITDQPLSVKVQRLFKPLNMGDEFIDTDENGAINLAIESGIPGVDGNLTFEVMLNESDDYGTVKALTTGAVGIPIVEKSTFDQRTMWSPRNKTPIFLLIFPNLLILGVWGLIFYLILNLFKLSKS
ncbi:MAG: hypothetical protein L3J34_09430 [Flavobacteriaceae bacterium]|nr:hypothetical protein [Flavobacteriaceae bacterium]